MAPAGSEVGGEAKHKVGRLKESWMGASPLLRLVLDNPC